jgi:hypothetical protein
MDYENSKSQLNIHALGVRYICDYLDRAGFTIQEVNTDPDHHFQLLAKTNNKVFLIAVRTDYYPDIGTIDSATQEQLIRESERLNSIPHFAGLTATPIDTNDIEVDGLTEGRGYKFTFYGMTVVH